MTTLKDKINRILGNNVRLLLPSYWWKRVFGLVIDRIEEVENAASGGITIVSSEEELNTLDLPNGSVASVNGVKKMKFSECYQLSSADNDLELEDLAKKLTIVKEIGVNFPLPTFTTEHNAAYRIYNLNGNQISGGVFILIDGVDYRVGYTTETDSGEFLIKSQTDIDRINDILGSGDFYYIALENNGLESENIKIIDTAFYVVSDSISATAYIKGDSWERLVKESDLRGIVGGSGEDNVVTFYAPIDNVSLSDTENQHNAESYQKVADGFESDTYYDIKVLLSTSQLVALDVIKTINPAIDNGRLKLIFGGVGSGIDLQMLTVTSDGSATITIEGDEESGVELRDLYIYENYDGTLTELTEEQKAWNVETLELAKQGKAIVRTTLHGNTFILELFNEDDDYQFGYTQFSPSGGIAVSVYVGEDGLSGIKVEESHFDSELSSTSTNAVQNKVVTAYVDAEVAKKQNTLISGTNIKTINGNSILGEGNIVVGVDTSNLATKEEVNSLVNDAISSAITNVLNTGV